MSPFFLAQDIGFLGDKRSEGEVFSIPRNNMPTITKEEASELRQALKKSIKAHTRETITLCKLLYDSYYAEVEMGDEIVPAFVLWNYEDWNEFVEHEVGMHWTTAHRYRRVYETFWIDFYGEWKADELPQSITKLQTLTRAPLTKRNISGWLKKGRELSCCQLHHVVTGEDEGDVCITAFRMAYVDCDELKQILDDYKEEFGATNRGDVLINIVRQWKRAKKKARTLKKVS